MKNSLKKNKFFYCFTIILSIFVLPNCAKYNSSQLPYPTGYSQESNNVKIITRKLTDSECTSCFDSNETAEKYDVIQLYVKNKSNKDIILSGNNIDVEIETTKNIARTIHRNTAGRVTGYGIGALFIWPLIIPAAVDGAKSSNANYKADEDLKVKVLGHFDYETIEPNHAVNKVFFVTKGRIAKEFNLTIIEKDSDREINFHCIV